MSADGTRKRRRLVAAAAGLVLLAGAGVAVAAGYERLVAGDQVRPVTDEEVAATCRERYTDLRPDLTSEPVQRFVARDGGFQARVYVAEADNWMIVCRSDAPGIRTMGTWMEPRPQSGIQLFSADDAVMKFNAVLGRMPAGATALRARLASGRVVAGAHDGDVFVVWAAGDSVRGAQLTATGPDGAVIAVAAAPTQF